MRLIVSGLSTMYNGRPHKFWRRQQRRAICRCRWHRQNSAGIPDCRVLTGSELRWNMFWMHGYCPRGAQPQLHPPIITLTTNTTRTGTRRNLAMLRPRGRGRRSRRCPHQRTPQHCRKVHSRKQKERASRTPCKCAGKQYGLIHEKGVTTGKMHGVGADAMVPKASPRD